jgi:hypothetical protein
MMMPDEFMEHSAVIRRRMGCTKNYNRSSAALNRKREEDGKFKQGPKPLFRIVKQGSAKKPINNVRKSVRSVAPSFHIT